MQNAAGMKLQKTKPRPEMSTLKSAIQNHRMHCSIKKDHVVSDFLSESQEPDHSLILMKKYSCLCRNTWNRGNEKMSRFFVSRRLLFKMSDFFSTSEICILLSI